MPAVKGWSGFLTYVWFIQFAWIFLEIKEQLPLLKRLKVDLSSRNDFGGFHVYSFVLCRSESAEMKVTTAAAALIKKTPTRSISFHATPLYSTRKAVPFALRKLYAQHAVATQTFLLPSSGCDIARPSWLFLVGETLFLERYLITLVWPEEQNQSSERELQETQEPSGKLVMQSIRGKRGLHCLCQAICRLN